MVLAVVLLCICVAPPRGERGLKHPPQWRGGRCVHSVAPPRGERGLKHWLRDIRGLIDSRSPSWGAWIETLPHAPRSCPLWVAPPRGERGLKPAASLRSRTGRSVAPPRGERGLKPLFAVWDSAFNLVAPPRGERGLKLADTPQQWSCLGSLPLVGSVD